MKLPQALYDQIVARALACPAEEICGLISGSPDLARTVWPIASTERSPYTFFMDPAEQFTAMKAMRQKKEEFLAIYHSHPTAPAQPSAKDVALAVYPVAHIIVSLVTRPPVVRAFRIEDGEIYPEPLEII